MSLCFIIVLTRKWSESQLGPLRVRTSCIIYFVFVFVSIWWVWFSVVTSGEIQVPLWIVLCWNWANITVNLFSIAKLHSISIWNVVIKCALCTTNCTPYSTHHSLNTMHYELYTIKYTVHITHHKLYTIHYTVHSVHYTPFSKHYALQTIHHTIYSAHYALQTIHHTPHTIL